MPGVRVLADLWAAGLVREVATVLGAVALLAVAARVVIPLPFTPVPLSLATLAVLGTGAMLGPRRATAATFLYALLGVAGAPVFADGRTGWAFASFGYILGYVAAAALVGWLAERVGTRSARRVALMGVAGTAVVYVAGLAWMVPWLDLAWGEALALGVVPFLIGDALKVLVVAGLVPTVWKVAGRR